MINALDDHNGLVAAFAGVAVAIFTAVLWRATERLWLAGERQIVHLEREGAAARRAWLTVEDVRTDQGTQFTTEGAQVVVRYTIKNLGLTPAVAIWHRAQHHFTQAGPFMEAFSAAAANGRALIADPFPGEVLFPGDTLLMRETWSISVDELQVAIRTVEGTGVQLVDLSIFVGAYYRVVGDPDVHTTLYAFEFNNLHIGGPFAPPAQPAIRELSSATLPTKID